MFMERNLKDVIKGPAHFLYQAALTALISSVDVSLSFTADFIADRFMFLWRQRKELSRIGRNSPGDGAYSLFQLYSRKPERQKIVQYGK